MIISKKRFEEELSKRMNEEDFKRSVSGDLYRLQDEVRNLTWRVENLENAIFQKTVTTVATTGMVSDGRIHKA